MLVGGGVVFTSCSSLNLNQLLLRVHADFCIISIITGSWPIIGDDGNLNIKLQ